MGEVFQRVHRDRALAFLCFEIVGLALALFVAARQRRARPDVLYCIGPWLPVALRLAVFQRPGDDADAAHMLVVDRHRPGQFGTALLALRHSAGLTDIRDDEGIRCDAFGMAHHAVAARQILDQVVAYAEGSPLPADLRRALHQGALELVAADRL